MTQTDISVIITTFNRASFIEEALFSVLNQTVRPKEILIIDDGSTDGTHHLLTEYSDHIHYIYIKNQGISASRNTGIRLTSGRFVAFLDSDDLWLPEKLALQAASFEKNPDDSFCYTDEHWIRRGRPVNQREKHQKFSGDIYLNSLPLCIISPSSVMLKREVLDKIGLFDETLPAGEDYDLWLRMTSRYQGSFVSEKCIVKRGGHQDQLSSMAGIDRYRILSLVKMITDVPLSESKRSATIDMLRSKTEIYIKGCKAHGKDEEADEIQRLTSRIVT